ncbi:hypothetical protein F8388_023465 [Cannabis sativa]|uniref:Uncharacterized protein n=1 Tax=Cannabis sativa TaxID=3483 RepID=A0A7J6FL05_CANSA|nr:hypothetical protein F8388_023465 [Cannabis sativa]
MATYHPCLKNTIFYYIPSPPTQKLVKDGGDACRVDKVVGDVPAVDVIQTEVVAGSEDRTKDVENVKAKESGVTRDDFFNGLSQLEVDDEQVVLASLKAVAKINLNFTPNVVVEKADAIASDEEADVAVTYTPLLDKRKRAPILKSPFVDFGSADVSSTLMEVISSGSQSRRDERDFKMVTYAKGLYALKDSFSDPIFPEIEAKFDAWISKGLLKYPRPYNVYEDGAKKISPGFRLGVDYVEDKTGFYHLSCCDMFINDSHMNTIFYYLRKKGKYSSTVTNRCPPNNQLVYQVESHEIFPLCLQLHPKTTCKPYYDHLTLVVRGFHYQEGYPQLLITFPEKLAFYDYIDNNSAKGGLFRAGSMDNGDGIAVGCYRYKKKCAIKKQKGEKKKSHNFCVLLFFVDCLCPWRGMVLVVKLLETVPLLSSQLPTTAPSFSTLDDTVPDVSPSRSPWEPKSKLLSDPHESYGRYANSIEALNVDLHTELGFANVVSSTMPLSDSETEIVTSESFQ